MTFRRSLNVLGTVVFAGIALYAIGSTGFQMFETHIKGSFAGQNLLEKAVQVGVSDSASMQSFKNAGGLDAAGEWKGYKVRRVDTMFDNSNKLSLLNLTLERSWPGKKLASTDNLLKSLAEECGASWSMVNQATNMHHAETNSVSCFVSENGRDGMSIGVRAKLK